MKKRTFRPNQIRVSSMVEEIVFRNKVQSIVESMLSSQLRLKEDEQLDDKEEQAMDKLMSVFTAQLKKAAPEIAKTVKDAAKVEKLASEYPEIEKLEKVQEGELNEFVITTTFVAGVLASIPPILKIFSWLANGIATALSNFGFLKASARAKSFANTLAHASHEVHEGYITMIQGTLKLVIPDFKEIPETEQKKIAEIVYMIIVFYLGMHAGMETINAFQHAQWAHVGVEGLLTAIKSGELGAWLADSISTALA
jgi:hypothetical protein